MPRRHPATEAFARHVSPAFVELLGVLGYGRVYVRARGVELWDSEGRAYLDLLAGFGAQSFGHHAPRLVRAAQDALGSEEPSVMHVGPAPAVAALAEDLAKLTDGALPIALLAGSGAEAVEAAVKFARAATGRPEVLFCDGAYHGLSLGTLSLSASPRLTRPFLPLLPDCRALPFGDIDALSAALQPERAAAFVVEPIQGEAGVHLPPAGYLPEALQLCRRHGTLLVADEVQTGLGRTGRILACDHEGIRPDVLVLGKALGGGILPVSAALVSAEIHARAYGSMERFDLHGSTFAGYSAGCVVAREALAMLTEERLAENAARQGDAFLEGLRRRLTGHPLVRDIRGRGLLVGIELQAPASGMAARVAPQVTEAASRMVLGPWVSLCLLELGVVCQPASQAWNVLKLTPPLTIDDAATRRAVDAIVEVLAAYDGLGGPLAATVARIGGQLLRGRSFR